MSTRRLRRSISAGRLLEAEKVSVPENDKGIENHIPFVNRLVGWWARMREKGWRDQATPEQLGALKRDLEPVFPWRRTLSAPLGRGRRIPLEREFRFHPERRWRSDFAHLPSRRLTEIEGGLWILGRHSTGAWRAPVQTAEGSPKGEGAVGRRPNQPGLSEWSGKPPQAFDGTVDFVAERRFGWPVRAGCCLLLTAGFLGQTQEA